MTTLSEWMPHQEWDALVRGEDCPLCAECQSSEPVNEHGFTIADMDVSRLRLAANQYVAGYSVLIYRGHAREPYELERADRAAFFEDMCRAARAIERVCNPVKMNFQILGNAVPHLHAHLVPRYYGDPAPGRPIDPGAREVRLLSEEYAERIRLIREAL